MKAVIMAGGEGKRLRPITDNTPKPLLSIAGVPAIKRILKHLKENGVDEAVITVSYLADKIKNALNDECEGIRLKYINESSPLGTAGGVLLASRYIDDEDFIVISGDALSEADISSAYEEHKRKKALVTMILSRQSDPCEYGIVMTESDGKIKGFYEKPSLSSAYTNTVNTGIYIMSREIFDHIPKGKCDFGADIFPALLREGKSLFGIIDRGYWCDIGDFHSYRMANLRYQGGGSVIGDNSHVPKYSAVGSVILDNVTVGQNTRIENSVICSDTTVGRDCTIGENAVIGYGCTIGDGAVISDGTVLPSSTEVIENSFVKSGNLISHAEFLSYLDGKGISCPVSLMSPSFCIKLGSALSETVNSGRMGIMTDGDKESIRIQSALLRGMSAADTELLILGEGFEAAASYASSSLCLDLSVFIRTQGDEAHISFYDENGLYPKREFERRLSTAISSSQKSEFSAGARSSYIDFVNDRYYPMLIKSRCSLDGLKFCIKKENASSKLLKRVLTGLKGMESDDGIKLSVSDDGFYLSCEENGFVCDDWHIKALIMKYLIRDDVCLPVNSPSALHGICRGKLFLFSHCPSGKNEDASRHSQLLHPELSHACAAGAELMGLINVSKRSLKELSAHIPSFAVASYTFNIKDKERLTVLPIMGTPDGDGVISEYAKGRVRIVPHRYGFSLYSEAVSGEYASELISLSEKEIKRLLKAKEEKE